MAGAHLFFNAFWLIPHFLINSMYMCDTMHQIDSGVILSFLKAILRKFRECVEIPLVLLGKLQRRLQTDCAGSWERKEQRAAISCTVPMRVWFPSTSLPPMYSSNWRKSKRPLATHVPQTTAICCCCCRSFCQRAQFA